MKYRTPLEQILAEQDVSVDDLAKRVSRSPNTIYRLKRGETKARMATLVALARELHVSVDTFDEMLDVSAEINGRLGGLKSQQSPKENRENDLVALAVLQP